VIQQKTINFADESASPPDEGTFGMTEDDFLLDERPKVFFQLKKSYFNPVYICRYNCIIC